MVKITATVNVAWAIGATVAICLKCTPVSLAWDPLVPGHCYDFRLFTLLVEVPNFLLDFVVMVLPIGVLRHLQVKMRYKISLALIFVMGSL